MIKLEDPDNHNEDVSQDIVVYDKDVENLTPGELYQVDGEIFVERKPGSGKRQQNGQYLTCLFYQISQEKSNNNHRR